LSVSNRCALAYSRRRSQRRGAECGRCRGVVALLEVVAAGRHRVGDVRDITLPGLDVRVEGDRFHRDGIQRAPARDDTPLRNLGTARRLSRYSLHTYKRIVQM